MTELRAGELTDAEIDAAREPLISQGEDTIYRAIATAAHEKAMKRAAEICKEQTVFFDADDPSLRCAAAIEREAK